MYSNEAMKKFAKQIMETKWGKDHIIITGMPMNNKPNKKED